MLPEIWCATDNFLSYWLTFLPFDPTLWKKCKKTWTYYPSYTRVPKWRSYDVWLLKYKGTTDSLLTFFALLPKKSIFKKNEKKRLEILSFYTSVSKIMIICYAILFLRYDAWRIVVFYFELFFFPFYPFAPNIPKNKNQKKNVRKKPGHVIILHKCTKNHDRMLYCSWDMARDGCNCYFSLWAIFCPFTPTNSPKKI